jgi:cytochrome P450 / NADPH-cytochrome P450 reductase
VRVPREGKAERQAALALRREAAAATPVVRAVEAARREWDQPSEIPATSAYRHLVVAYGSNFGTNKGLAERFAERSTRYGYTSEVMTLNELAERAPSTDPWLLVVMTSTYTSNPPANALAFKSWLERTDPGTAAWRSCRYLVWGLGNSQWNAFLAFPHFVHRKLAELGATPVADFAYGDVGSPVWEQVYAAWNDEVWPALIELAGARPSERAAARIAAEEAKAGELTRADSSTAMAKSLRADDVAPRVLLVPTILTNTVGIETFEARATVCRELHAEASPKRARHLEVSLPPGAGYTVGDHLGICPRNDEERVERLARHLGAALDGLFMVPKSMDVQAVPKGVVLQTRNVLTNLVDITGLPTVPLLDLLVAKATDPGERSRLEAMREVLQRPDGPESPLRETVRAGGYDVLSLLDEFPSCSLNVFEFLQVAQPLRPRYYSTSSSPRIHGDGVAHVAVGLAREPVPGMPDREFRGMSAHYVHTLREGDRVNVFLESADGFHLQEDVTKPMIFVSAGTGFAPMRAFLWERLALKREGAELAEAMLVNGIRSRGLDDIYRDEIEEFAASGVLDHVHVVTSREHPGRREYVQDRIREQSALVWRLLEAGGYVYVCGSQAMREGVREAFVDLVTEHAPMPREHAEAFLSELETAENRYRPDLWV